MKFKSLLLLLFVGSFCIAQAQLPAPDTEKLADGKLTIQPVNHATLVLGYNQTHIYIDPVGGVAAFAGLAPADLVLVTDIHGDHMDPKTLQAINTEKTIMVVPQAVADKLPVDFDKSRIIVLPNGQMTEQMGVSIAAIPMYNLPEAPDAFHTKGRGNGYVLTMGGKNIYISGDTEDIPEMRALQNIDIAFVCMNLPYTMDVNQAAQGVLAFQPKIIYPYHYRGQNVETFKDLVAAGNSNIEVRLRNWYPAGK